MSPLAVIAVAAALLQQGAAPLKSVRGAGPATLSCRIGGADRVTFRLDSTPQRGGPRRNPRLHYATVRLTDVARKGAHADARTLAAINAQLASFRPLLGGAHVVCKRRSATLVVLGWRDADPVRLELKAPAKGLAGLKAGPLLPDWTN
jgi:hypothetical protein